MSLKEEHEKLKERFRECVVGGDGRAVVWNRRGELNHGGHMSGRKREKEKEVLGRRKGSVSKEKTVVGKETKRKGVGDINGKRVIGMGRPHLSIRHHP